MTQTFAHRPFRVRLFRKLMALATAIQSLPARITPPPFRLIQMGAFFWQSRALYVATRLGIADALGDGERPVDELAKDLQLDEEHLFRLLRMLSSLGIFTRSRSRAFRNSAASHYLRKDHPQSVRAMILMHNSPEMTSPWLEPLEQGIREGSIPFAAVHGSALFDYMDRHREFDLLFGRAMDAVESLTGTEYLDDFKWALFDRVIDVGGSKGTKSAEILRRNPGMEALVFDRPQIIDAARQQWDGSPETALRDRLAFEGGDMFEGLPPARSDRDVYLFVAVFHGLSDGEGVRVLERLRAAMGGHRARAVIVEMVMPESNPDAATCAFDMQMLVNTRGRERTRTEWVQLLRQGGFGLEEVVPARTFPQFIVASPG